MQVLLFQNIVSSKYLSAENQGIIILKIMNFNDFKIIFFFSKGMELLHL